MLYSLLINQSMSVLFFFCQAEDGIRDPLVTGVQTCALPISLRLAGLCHAWYGTDGFQPALGDPHRREELAAITGAEAERLVYVYARCDRRFSYPHLAKRAGPFKDRFTGTVHRPPLRLRRDFAELTAANELDIAAVNPDL